MEDPDPREAVASHLERMRSGDDSSAELLLPLVYEDLRAIAGGIYHPKGRDQTLQPTALVHEAYLRLVDSGERCWESRSHFLAVAAIAMRQLLANYGKAKATARRGGDRTRVVLDEQVPLSEDGEGFDLIALDELLRRFESLDPRRAKVVRLRFLTGLSIEETAEVLKVSPRTVGLDWQFARAWLRRELKDWNPA